MGLEFTQGALDPILGSPAVQSMVEEATQRALDATGEGYVSHVELQSSRRGGGRWRGVVIAATPEAMRDNATNQTLLRAADNI